MKRQLVILVLGLIAMGMWAQPITEKQALDRVMNYLHTNGSAKARGMDCKLTKLNAVKVEAQSIYAFNNEGGGYVIASGDSRALPVLGYATEGQIDWERMPQNMREFLKSYDKAIATLGDNCDFADGNWSKGFAQTRKSRATIAPMLKTNWDQGAPYWDLTPPYEGANPNYQEQLSATGCVATAMAQVMNYHQWPKGATKEIPAYDIVTAYENKEKVWHVDALPSVTFDWGNMIDSYVDDTWNIVGTEDQQKAVATLMRYCGQSVYMYYSPEASGSDHQQVVEALIRYFGYDPSLYDAPRVKYSIEEWENLIYGELAEGRPVQYGGSSDDGGHSFVCDGYDGNGLFHINWGWGGQSDGYFSLAVLNPYNNYSMGAGSGGIGFCTFQDAVIGVKPAAEGAEPKPITPQAYLYPYEPLGVIEPDSAYFEYYFNSFSYGDNEVRVDFAFGTIADDGALIPMFMGDRADSIVYNYDVNYHVVKIDSMAFEPGKYAVLYPMVKFRSIPGSDWQMLGAKENHIYAGRQDNGQFFLVKETPQLTIKKAEITRGGARLGMRNDVTLTIHNAGASESTLPLVLLPLYFGDMKPEDIKQDTPYTEGEPLYSNGFIPAEGDADVTFCFKPLKSGLVYLVLYTPAGIPLADAIVEVSDVMGCYDDYVLNQSEVYVTDADESDESEIGLYTYHVEFVDNAEENIPKGKPSENIYRYAVIADVNNTDGKGNVESHDIYQYLNDLPEKGGDGTYDHSFDLEYNITRGGRYYVWSYINEWLNEDMTEYIISCSKYMEFTVNDVPALRTVGNTSVGSGEPLDLQLHLTTGWPYDPSVFTGNEEVEYTLFSVEGNDVLTPLRSETQKLTFAQGDPNLAVVDTLKLTDVLPDGNYLIRVSTSWEPLALNYVEFSVGGTGIDSVVGDEATGVYTDLRGMRLEGRPARKGIYIRNGKKVVVK